MQLSCQSRHQERGHAPSLAEGRAVRGAAAPPRRRECGGGRRRGRNVWRWKWPVDGKCEWDHKNSRCHGRQVDCQGSICQCHELRSSLGNWIVCAQAVVSIETAYGWIADPAATYISDVSRLVGNMGREIHSGNDEVSSMVSNWVVGISRHKPIIGMRDAETRFPGQDRN